MQRQATGYNAWISKVIQVRRDMAADKSVQTIQIFAEWRQPAAWVRAGDMAYLIDAAGTWLPGDYPLKTRQAGRLMTLAGLELPVADGKSVVPLPGELWRGGASGEAKSGPAGEDLLAGMKMIGALQGQKYVKQIDAIDLSNFGGRKDAKAAWITLATVFAGDQGVPHVVQWGRPIGREKFYDWKAADKLKGATDDIYGRFGRIDLGREYVDIHAEGVRIPHLASQADEPAKFLRGVRPCAGGAWCDADYHINTP